MSPFFSVDILPSVNSQYTSGGNENIADKSIGKASCEILADRPTFATQARRAGCARPGSPGQPPIRVRAHHDPPSRRTASGSLERTSAASRQAHLLLHALPVGKGQYVGLTDGGL